ncbi:hypothetical protein CDV31_004908 [Fusarium ambrosium]|uniref:AB hydrolase-1 domain-containing protein n=1 Tax=Fusarium ambrosium TaxID=131363 RepID=A0A428UMN0_9HYPO|nr:hypothetical protein CDV31_004908 [Fusarium ambrosium]
MIVLVVALLSLFSSCGSCFTTSTDQNLTWARSADGHARCLAGTVLISIDFESYQWEIELPTNQLETTDFVMTAMTTDANGLVSLIKETKQLKKTFNIFIKYCVPAKEKKVTTNVIQILTHGSTLDHTYWDFALGYSCVNVAAAPGLATLSYDRLGIGLPDHPNPLLETQGQAQIEIYHGLAQLVRSGALGHSFSKVIAVGYSYGSTLGDGTLSKYLNDFDALINTDYDGPLAWLKHTIFSLGLLKANTLPRLAHLPDGYLVREERRVFKHLF